MRMNKIELTNMVEITYCKDTDRNNSCNTLLTAMVHVPVNLMCMEISILIQLTMLIIGMK